MSYWGRSYKCFLNQSLLTKSSLGLGFLVALMVIVALTGYFSLRYLRMANNAINTNSEIQQFVLEMDGGMAKARHLHGKFFFILPQNRSA